MIRIQDYEVTVPPTSGEVETLVFDALRHRSAIGLTLRPIANELQREPTESNDVVFSINQMRYHENGGITLLGSTATSEVVNLQLAPDPEIPASVSMVTNN